MIFLLQMFLRLAAYILIFQVVGFKMVFAMFLMEMAHNVDKHFPNK